MEPANKNHSLPSSSQLITIVVVESSSIQPCNPSSETYHHSNPLQSPTSSKLYHLQSIHNQTESRQSTTFISTAPIISHQTHHHRQLIPIELIMQFFPAISFHSTANSSKYKPTITLLLLRQLQQLDPVQFHQTDRQLYLFAISSLFMYQLPSSSPEYSISAASLAM